MNLPVDLQAAVAAWLERNGPPKGRRDASRALTATYRGGGSSRDVDFAAYLVTRLPATHAAVARVLAELALLRPGFSPSSLLDAGSGPGTASWAALDRWPGIGAVTLLDESRPFLDLAAELARHGAPPLASATLRQGRLEALPAGLTAELVIAAYALAELPAETSAKAARHLWASSEALLVLVEPGTPQGFARLRAARDVLLAEGAVPVAPCTHAQACPMISPDWCRFAVRLPRSRAHMHAKAASLPFEDEPFTYLVMARDGGPTPGARIVSPPDHAKPAITFRLCREGRIERHAIARRDAVAYKQARKLGWGDLLVGAATEEDDIP